MTALEFTIALRTKTGLNSREHHFARAKRVEGERLVTRAAFRQAEGTVPFGFPAKPLLVTLTRVGPRRVDDDGAIGGLKAVRDELAACLGVDDGDRKRVRWRYGVPEIGPYAVRVRIEPLARVCPACGRSMEAA